jgi:hypothetical protein
MMVHRIAVSKSHYTQYCLRPQQYELSCRSHIDRSDWRDYYAGNRNRIVQKNNIIFFPGVFVFLYEEVVSEEYSVFGVQAFYSKALK